MGNNATNPIGMWDPSQFVSHWNDYDRSRLTGDSKHKGDKWLAYINRNIPDAAVRKELYSRIYNLYSQRKAAGQQLNKYDLRSIEAAMKQKYNATGQVPSYFDISGWSFDSTMAARLNSMITTMNNMPIGNPGAKSTGTVITTTTTTTPTPTPTPTKQQPAASSSTKSTTNTNSSNNTGSTDTGKQAGPAPASKTIPASKAGMPSDVTRLGNGKTVAELEAEKQANEQPIETLKRENPEKYKQWLAAQSANDDGRWSGSRARANVVLPNGMSQAY